MTNWLKPLVVGVVFLLIAALSLSGCEKVLESPTSPSATGGNLAAELSSSGKMEILV